VAPLPILAQVSALRGPPVRPPLGSRTQTCRQGVIAILGDRAAHVDAFHTSPAQKKRKSVFFTEVQWRDLLMEAQLVVAIPDIARPDFCIRAAHASHDIGIDRSADGNVCVITKLDGTLWTTYPGIPVAWYGQ
jgi:hypothetical protein